MVTLLLLCRRLGSATRSFVWGAAAVVCPPPGIRPGIKNVLISGEDACEGGRPLFALLGVLGAVTSSLISGVEARRAGKAGRDLVSCWTRRERRTKAARNLGFGIFKSVCFRGEGLFPPLHGRGCRAAGAALFARQPASWFVLLTVLGLLGPKKCFHPSLRVAVLLALHAFCGLSLCSYFTCPLLPPLCISMKLVPRTLQPRAGLGLPSLSLAA